MRIVKFRAWDKQSSVWRPISSLDWYRKGGQNICGAVVILEDGRDQYLDISNIEVVQFTGLKDKNGKDIYEGDILKAEDDESPVVVEWLAERNGWSFNQEFVNGGAPKQQAEVIGNIYENPELLK